MCGHRDGVVVRGYPREMHNRGSSHTEEPWRVDKTPVQPCHGEVMTSPMVGPGVCGTREGGRHEFAVMKKIVEVKDRVLGRGSLAILLPRGEDGIEVSNEAPRVILQAEGRELVPEGSSPLHMGASIYAGYVYGNV